MKNAQIHRFGDRVAVSLPGKGETVYLSEKEARELARVLVDCARNIKGQPKFSESDFVTASVDIADPFRGR
ncbi:TPA: hypothetical protein SL339_000788 [Pseudomonas aeruginosa]|nr:hypothetical protein [Pseudomonas aeruginosa]